MALPLRHPNKTTSDPRTDWIHQADHRNWQLSTVLSDHAETPPVSRWHVPWVLDQGQEGACVGAAYASLVAAKPSGYGRLLSTHFGGVSGVMSGFAREQIYWQAQRIDPWPGGEYPGARPKGAGTSLLAGAKVMRHAGWFKSFYWAANATETASAIATLGPVALGTLWYEGMTTPKTSGVVKPTGGVVGGHAVCLTGFDGQRFEFNNSWGRGWGKKGRGFISFEDLDGLFTDGACQVVAPQQRAELT